MLGAVLRFWEPRALALLRIMTALIFLQHGLQKLIAFPLPPVPGYQHFLSPAWPGFSKSWSRRFC